MYRYIYVKMHMAYGYSDGKDGKSPDAELRWSD